MRTNKIIHVFRFLSKNKISTIINLIGLSTGFAVVFLISIYIKKELTTDRFHENYSQIYRFTANDFNETVDTPGPLAEFVKDKVPEVEQTVRIAFTYSWGLSLKYNNTPFYAKDILFADSTFFDLFSFKAISGDLSSALKSTNSIVLTKRFSQKIFGNDILIGKQLTFNNKEILTVTAIVDDIPYNSSLNFNGIASFHALEKLRAKADLKNWGYFDFQTFCKIKQTNITAIESKINSEFHQFQPEREKTTFSLQPFNGLYFNNDYNDDQLKHGNIQSIIFLGISAMLIIALAIINFINLSLAGLSSRLKAIGVQKVVGAQKKHIYWVFFNEAIFIITLSGIIGTLTAIVLLPAFNIFTSSSFSSSQIVNLHNLVIFSGLLIFMSLFSAYIPYTVVNKQNIQQSLKNQFQIGKSKSISKHILVASQFLVTIVLITTTLFINKQIRFINNKNLGFEKDDNIILLFLEENTQKNYSLLKEQLIQYPQFSNISLSHSTPGTIGMQWGGELSYKGEKKKVNYFSVPVTPGYLEMMGYRIKKGRFFSDSIASDKGCFILNETAAKEYGIYESPLDAEFVNFGEKVGKIIGIIEDFNFESLHQKVKPLAFSYIPQWGNSCSLVSIKTNSDDFIKTSAIIRSEFQKLFPEMPFECFKMKDIFSEFYIKENNLNKIISSFSLLSIIIGCLGLIGIVNITIVSKTKEICIRKVNGARISEVMTMLNKDFVKWVTIAFIIATPIAWYVMHKWLENFAYKTELSWWIFVLSGVSALVIALLTVSWQSWKAATRNPVEALRYE